MKVLFFGDVYGKPGREAVKVALKKWVEPEGIDFVIVNGENMAHGHGILPEQAQEFFDLGVDVITTGNHAWDQKQIVPFMGRTTRLLRPANYPDHPLHRVPGRGSTVIQSMRNPNKKLGVIQVMGRVFMPSLDCPFRVAEAEFNRLEEADVTCVVIDFHGEATSEKQAFAYFMDGRVGAVVGTHSHVQTADERILPNGTAAITDVGMCGVFDSVIGVKKELSIQKFLTQRSVRYEPAEGSGGYGCVLVELDDSSGKARSIRRIRETSVL